MWAEKWLLGRDRFTHLNLLNFIRNDSPEDYKNYLRMSDENIQYLIAKVKPLIAKQDTVMRNASTPEACITATLHFLATGRLFEDLKFAMIISPQALGKIIPEMRKAIYEALKHDYLKVRKCESGLGPPTQVQANSKLVASRAPPKALTSEARIGKVQLVTLHTRASLTHWNPSPARLVRV